MVGGVLLGAFYLFKQYQNFGALKDPIFVGLILANTVTAFRFGVFFKARLIELIGAFNTVECDNPDPIERDDAINRLFEDKLGILFAICFAGAISGSVHFMRPWQHMLAAPADIILTDFMAAFLFVANLMVGFGLFCLGKYWKLSADRIAQVKLTILNPSRPDLVMFQAMTKMVVVLSATLSCIAISALVFSVFQLDTMTVFFSIASFMIVLCAYFVPIIPLSAIFRQAKFDELNRIELMIAAHYEHTLAPTPDAVPHDLDALITYRNEVRSIKTLPPGGEFSVVTAGTVAFIPFLPIMFEFALTHFQNIAGGVVQ